MPSFEPPTRRNAAIAAIARTITAAATATKRPRRFAFGRGADERGLTSGGGKIGSGLAARGVNRSATSVSARSSLPWTLAPQPGQKRPSPSDVPQYWQNFGVPGGRPLVVSIVLIVLR